MPYISIALTVILSTLLRASAVMALPEEELEIPQAIVQMVESGASVVPADLGPLSCSDAKVIYIYLRSQVAALLERGAVVKVYQISSGAPSTPTPRGVFQIHKKEELRVSGQDVPYRMPHYMAFTKNHAFGLHGLPYLGNSADSSAYWQEAQTHIGKPVSHGCVRFLPDDAAEIFAWAEVGTPVVIQH